VGETGRLPTSRRPLVLVLAAVLVALPACGVSGLSFVQDDRVDIVGPDDRSEVRLPVTVRWTVEGFDVGPDGGSFGVFVDRSPQPSGRTLGWLFRGDSSCKGAGARLCDSTEFLEQRNVFRTTRTSLTLEQVPRLTGADAGRVLHEVTVVLLDGDGRRAGEGAWSVQFEVEDERR
jgi:hypothetical protein